MVSSVLISLTRHERTPSLELKAELTTLDLFAVKGADAGERSASRQTELARENPMGVVCVMMDNTPEVSSATTFRCRRQTF